MIQPHLAMNTFAQHRVESALEEVLLWLAMHGACFHARKTDQDVSGLLLERKPMNARLGNSCSYLSVAADAVWVTALPAAICSARTHTC